MDLSPNSIVECCCCPTQPVCVITCGRVHLLLTPSDYNNILINLFLLNHR